MKLLIAVPTGEFARRADFYDYLGVLAKPVGTIETRVHGQSPARNRNIAIKQALENDCTHILFIDDDVMPPVDTVNQLAGWNKDIVTGLYLMRHYPHKPIIFNFANEKGECLHHYLRDGEKGLIEIINCGLGCALIKTSVFRNLEEPWIRLGELEKDHWCDDIGFFNRVRAAGYKIYCDLSVRAGHVGSMIIWPTTLNKKWFTTYDTKGEGTASVPQVVPEGVKNG